MKTMVYRHTDPRRPALGLGWEDLELGLMEGPVHAAEKHGRTGEDHGLGLAEAPWEDGENLGS